jgi:hypothetical protein
VLNMKLRPQRPSVASLIALLALFVALGGPAEAAKLINGKNIKAGTVRGKQIKNRSLTTSDLSSAAVRALMSTPSGSIGNAQLAPSAVTGTTIADDSVTAADLAAGSVGNSEIATSAVSRSKIGNNAVSTGEILNDSVTASDLGSDSVAGSEVADGALTAKDVAAFAGTVTVDVPAIPANTCLPIEQDVTPVAGTQDLTDDTILVTPPAGAPGTLDSLVFTARAASATRLRINACNPGLTSTGAAPSQAFHYVSFTP